MNSDRTLRVEQKPGLKIRFASITYFPLLHGFWIYDKSPVYSSTISACTSRNWRPYPSKHANGVQAARMRKKPFHRKIVLRLQDLDHAKNSVLGSLSSPNSRRNYRLAMEQFII